MWNRVEQRPLEGFVAAITPFNFTAIGGNLGSSPAIVGNVTVWKPSDTAILSNYIVYKILREAGVPDGVVNFVPCDAPTFAKVIASSRHLAGIAFTGSTGTFKQIWRSVAQNLDVYRTFPRLVGETGGKNFHIVHDSADVDSVIWATVRAAFEYQGQKCSACSRLYVPTGLWPQIRDGMLSMVRDMRIGQPDDPSSFLGAVINAKAATRIEAALEAAKKCAAGAFGRGAVRDAHDAPARARTRTKKGRLGEDPLRRLRGYQVRGRRGARTGLWACTHAACRTAAL